MKEAQLLNKTDSYAKWEPLIDTTTFVGAGVIFNAAYSVAFIDPIAIGMLTAAGVNALASMATSKFFTNNSKQFQLLKLCASVAAIALVTFALPYALGALAVHSFIALSFQAALTMGIINVVTKVATYTAYRVGNWLKGSFSFPKKIEDLAKLKQEELKVLKAHFAKFPNKVAQFPLRFQVALNMRLKKGGIEPLPLSDFPELGTKWSREERADLHSNDLTAFSMKKKKEIAQFFFNSNDPPQNREYQPDELPDIRLNELSSSLSYGQAYWVDLYIRFHPAEIPPSIMSELQKWNLVPNDCVDFSDSEIPPDSDLKKSQKLEPLVLEPEVIEVLPVETLEQIYSSFIEDPQKFEQLPREIADALINRFQTLKIGLGSIEMFKAATTKASSLVGRVTENINWRKAGAVSLIALFVLNPLTAILGPVLFGGGGSNDNSSALAPAPQPHALPQQDFNSSLPEPSMLAPELAPEVPEFLLKNPPSWLNQLPKQPFSQEVGCPTNDCLAPYEPIKTLAQSHFCPTEKPLSLTPILSKPFYEIPIEENTEHIFKQHRPLEEKPPKNLDNRTCSIQPPMEAVVEEKPSVQSKSLEPSEAKTTTRTNAYGLLSIPIIGTLLAALLRNRKKQEAKPVAVAQLEPTAVPNSEGFVSAPKMESNNNNDPKASEEEKFPYQKDTFTEEKPSEMAVAQLVPAAPNPEDLVLPAETNTDKELRSLQDLAEEKKPSIQNIPKDSNEGEDSFDSSFLLLDALNSKTELKESDFAKEEGFFEVGESNNNNEAPQEWESAYRKLSGTEELGSNAVNIYAEFLKKESPNLNIVTDFLFPRMFDGNSLKAILNGIKDSNDEKPVYIPLILESSYNSIPFIYRYTSDHLVILVIDPKEKSIEYYNPQGGEIKDENRKVLGPDIKANELLKKMESIFPEFKVKSNPTKHQTDSTNCGTHVCYFMKLRQKKSFDQICSKEKIDILKERKEMAKDIKRYYAPPPLNEAESPEDVSAFLNAQPPRKDDEDFEVFLEKMTKAYRKGEVFDNESLFAQIDKDLSRDHGGLSQFVFNGETPSNARAIYNNLIGTLKKDQVLPFMSLLQQGIFGDIETMMLADLDIDGMDGGFNVRGHGNYLTERQKNRGEPIRKYELFIDNNKKITLRCSSYYELISSNFENQSLFRNKPYAILEAKVSVDFSNGKGAVSNAWHVDEIME